MQNRSETIVYFGSGPVSARALELLSKNFKIEAVISKPARSPKDPTPVLDVASHLNLKVYTPSNKKELDEVFRSNKFSSDLGILIDYGIIVSKLVIDSFQKGIINSHFSLLPEWRGADPITFSIISGQPTTGVSLMLIDEGMDTGLLLDQKKIEVDQLDNISLTAKLIELSDRMLKIDVPKFITGEIRPYPQPTDIEATYSRKLVKEDGSIDWTKTAEQIEREVRAFISWPQSTTKINNVTVIITKAHIVNESGTNGNYEVKDKNLIFFAGDKALSIDRLKPVGKKDMSIEAFLAGYKPIITKN